jgi:hypothetical protein
MIRMTPTERIAYALSTKLVRECVDSIREPVTQWSLNFGGKYHTNKPFPMSIYPDGSHRRRLYYARGWGSSVFLWPWENWLIRRSLHQRNLTPRGRG